MILCIPIMVILMIVCAHFGPSRPIAILLSSYGEMGRTGTRRPRRRRKLWRVLNQSPRAT